MSDGAKRASGLEVLKARLRIFYEDANNSTCRIPIGRLTLRKIKAKRYPKLKAKALQGTR